MTIADTCNGLVYMQRQRVFCIKSQSRCDRSMESFIATIFGFKTDQTEADRKKLFAMAKLVRTKFEKAPEDFNFGEWGPQVEGLAPMVLRSAAARASWDEHRESVEKDMKAAARTLPAWPFVESVRGISELGLAVIVGEAGDLGNYANPAKLWKRLGLAVMDGGRQGAVPAGLGQEARKDAWISRGYVGRRRAEVYVFLDDLLCRAQWRAEKVDEAGEVIAAHPIGSYGEIYARKKAEYIAREWTKGHADSAGRRYMAKCFLVDLMRAWKRNAIVDTSVDRSLFHRRHLSLVA